MNIIIPMAGMGKRLRPHTLTTAKPLLPIAGKPIVQRLVEDILATCNEKVENIAFIINPNFGQEVEQKLISVAESLGAKGIICYQEQALGTAHAILCAQELLNGKVFIAFADTLFDAQFKFDTDKDAIIWTQKVDNPSAFGVVHLADDNRILAFVEKPKEFVSDLAIIGVYYFKDGDNLRNELQYLIDNNIVINGEYQLTDAMDTMLKKGVNFYTEQVAEWLDCGNKDATVFTNQRILALKASKEELLSQSATILNSTIIQPSFIGANVIIENSVIGPHASIEANTKISDSRIKNSIVGQNSIVKNANFDNSLVGNHVTYNGNVRTVSLGDYSEEC